MFEVKDKCKIPVAHNADTEQCARGRKTCKGKDCPDYCPPTDVQDEQHRLQLVDSIKLEMKKLQDRLDALEPPKSAEKPIEKMNKPELIAKAIELGVELVVEDGETAETKAEIIELINAKLV